jgi:hypothetical protein
MKFTKPNVENLASCLDKMQRFFAYKYEVPKADIAFVIKGHTLNVMVDGKLKETILPSGLLICAIDEETGQIKKNKT